MPLNRQEAAFCPNCGTQRRDGGRYCGGCRYDFQQAAQSAPASAPKGLTSTQRLEAVVTVDQSLYEKSNPGGNPPDADSREVYPLTLADMTIGRKNASLPEPQTIPLSDPGASSRQARIVRLATGDYEIQDLGSANGTTLNGARLLPGVMAPIHAGDVITVGCWTRITLQPHGE